MIDKVYQLSTNELQEINKAFDSVHEQATGIILRDSEPTATEVPYGKVVIYDDGAANRRVYVRTGQEGVGYFTLTMI